MADVPVSIVVTGLSAATAYDLYLVGQDGVCGCSDPSAWTDQSQSAKSDGYARSHKGCSNPAISDDATYDIVTRMGRCTLYPPAPQRWLDLLVLSNIW